MGVALVPPDRRTDMAKLLGFFSDYVNGLK